MAHVHLLGDVGAGEIHHHRRAALRRRHPQARITQPLSHLSRQALGLEGEVDEAGAGDHGLQAELHKARVRLQLLHDRAGDLAGRLPQRLGQGQGPIRLEITEFRLAGRGELGIEGSPSLTRLRCRVRKRPVHRAAQLGVQGVGKAQHEQKRGEARR